MIAAIRISKLVCCNVDRVARDEASFLVYFQSVDILNEVQLQVPQLIAFSSYWSFGEIFKLRYICSEINRTYLPIRRLQVVKYLDLYIYKPGKYVRNRLAIFYAKLYHVKKTFLVLT